MCTAVIINYFQVYTIDNFYRKLTVVGYACLNVFVESGTERQPLADKAGLQVNLSLYSHVSNGLKLF